MKRETIGTIVTVIYADGEVKSFEGTSFAFVAMESIPGEQCHVSQMLSCEDNVHRVLLYNTLKDIVAEMKEDGPWLENTREVYEATLAEMEAKGGAAMKKQDENKPLDGQVTIEELTTLHEECIGCPWRASGDCEGNSEGIASKDCLAW